MTTFLNATKVGDRYRDVTGGVSTIEYIDGQTVITRRSSRGRFPTYSVRTAEGVRGIFRSVTEAIASL